MNRMAILAVLAIPLICPLTRATTRVEITKTDFTKMETIRSTEMEVFGVGLGDLMEDSKKKLRDAGLVLKEGAPSPESCAVFDAHQTELLVLDSHEGRIKKIALFDGISRFLAGNAKQLYDLSITEADSSIRLVLLGREDKRTVERNSIGSIVSCSYDREGIRVIRSFSQYGDAAPVIHLVPPARSR